MKRLVVLGLVLATTACAGSHEAMVKNVSEVRQQLLELRKSQARMSVTVEDLETRLFLVQDELDTTHSRLARARRPERELPVVRLKRKPGASANFDPMADTPRRRTQPKGKARFDSLDSSGDLVQGDPPADAGGPQAKSPPKHRTSKSDRSAMYLYQESYDHLKSNRFEKAVAGFQSFVRTYPNHGYADNSMYWMGEAYYARALWVRALEIFQKLLVSYPIGNKAPDAMLKLGLCHQQLRNLNQAREVLQQVTEIYPKSPVSKLAAARLEKL